MTERGGRPAQRLVHLLAGVQLLVMLTVNVPIVAVPVIQRQMGVAPVHSQFIVTTYALVWGALLLLAGRVADLAGRRRPLLAGLLLLAAGSGLGAAAPATPVLVAARAMQGGGAALAGTAALSLLVTLLPDGPARRRAFALFGQMTAVGSVAGLVLGGALTDLVGWRAIFLPSLLLAGALIGGAARWVPPDARSFSWPEFDLPGAATASAGIGLLVFAISRAEQSTEKALAGGAVAAALLAAFALLERRAAHPLLPLSLVTRRNTVAALVATVLIWSSFASLFFHLAFLLQRALHYTPLQSALAYLPVTVATALSGRVAAAGRLSPHLGLVTLGGGLAIAAGSATVSAAGAGGGFLWPVLPGLVLAGTGLGLAIVAIQILVFRGAAERSSGVLAGLLTTAQETASAVGTTVFATLAVAIGGLGGITTTLFWGAAAALAGGLLGALLAPRQGSRSLPARPSGESQP
ncbi:Major Facilitator Superfamily protein [Amycolatopsis arida]|uniref:Major Facilitator Superfamily protein n=1 Tax=Amycolatopsis arida TaxID=587909 RepID=A0A1I6AJH1_9PSEU|nr:MFS transporter [Amycolatopsis arida]TDX87324.1 MFS transporter [Amycolatopsis arida]SFQ68849.1 Major Facilitator Superfamily protein [Amycolatopsis arida]